MLSAIRGRIIPKGIHRLHLQYSLWEQRGGNPPGAPSLTSPGLFVTAGKQPAQHIWEEKILHRKNQIAGAMVFLLVLIIACPAASAMILMNVSGVTGYGQVAGYPNWTPLTSVEIVENMSFNPLLPTQGKPQLMIQISKPYDGSSVQLLKKHLPPIAITSASIVFLSSGASISDVNRYYQIDMAKVYITQIKQTGDEDSNPMEEYTLYPQQIWFRYYEGKMLKYSAGWDNRGLAIK